MNGAKLSYALVFGILALACRAWALDPVDHQPSADLVAALKKAGQVRIAQGLAVILAKDAHTGELFTTRWPTMLTTNAQTGEWTVSVLNDKIVGSTLLIGTNLKRVSGGDVPALATFDRQKASDAIAKLKDAGGAYYPDEVTRIQGMGYYRLFTGTFGVTTDPFFKQMKAPAFVDVMINPQDNAGFVILVVDQNGACAKIVSGNTFAEKP